MSQGYETQQSWPTTKPESSCVEWSGYRDKHGYGRASFDGRTDSAHRIAWQLANGPVPVGLCVLHKCDNPPCINPEHLFLGTQADNLADMTAKGRRGAVRGEQHPLAKLTREEVVCLRQLVAAGEPGRSVARRYGISHTQVQRIVARLRWPHVQSE